MWPPFWSTTHCKRHLHYLMLWSVKRHGSARHSRTMPASTDYRCHTSCRGRLASPAWPPNPGCCGHMSGSMQATFSRRRSYAIEFRAMCYGAPSCCRVHSWRPLASYAFIKIKLASCQLCSLYNVKYHCILQMHSVVTSKNESWPRLIWPTL